MNCDSCNTLTITTSENKQIKAKFCGTCCKKKNLPVNKKSMNCTSCNTLTITTSGNKQIEAKSCGTCYKKKICQLIKN